MKQLTGHLQPRRNSPTWASNVFITHPILRICPLGLPPVPWTEKTIEWEVDRAKDLSAPRYFVE
jgi:hypothetical protein